MHRHPETRRSRTYPSIRAALLIAVCAAIAPPLAIIVLSGIEHSTYIADHAHAEVARQADAFAEIQVRMTESARQVLQILASLPAFVDGDREQMTDTLRSVHESNPEYLNLTAVDTRGIVIASSLLEAGIDLSRRRHVRDSFLERRFVAGEYFLNLIDLKPSFAFSYPFFDASLKIAGSISATIKLDSYDRLFELLKLPKNSFLGLVDRNGTRLYFYPERETNPIGKPIKPSVWNRISSGQESETFIDEGSDGIPRIFGFRRLRLEGSIEPYMYLVYATPTADVITMTRSILLRNILLMIVVTIFSLFCAALLSQHLFGTRLADIIATTTRLREGDLSARANLGDDSSDLSQIGVALDLLADTIERRDAEKEEVARSLAASLAQKNILLKEVHHRVKNNLQLVLSLVRLQEDASGDSGTFRKNIESRISAMAVAHEMLYESGDMGAVDLGAYASRLIELVAGSWKAAVDVSVCADEVLCNLDTAVPFGLVLNELAVNAFKHAFKDESMGRLSVSIRYRESMVTLDVEDDGPGLPSSFVIETSPCLGLRLSQALALQLGGTLTWSGEGGAHFRVVFPVRSPHSG